MRLWIFAALLLASLAPAQRTVRVALCQIEVAADPETNLERIAAALQQAHTEHADLACFPEACLFGWTNPAAHAGATPIPGRFTDRLSALAKQHGLMVCCGLAEKDGEQLHNSVVLIDSDGALLLKHRKCNVLEELMQPPYAKGTGALDATVDTRFGRLGLLICADTFDDRVVAELAAQAPDLVLVPYGWAAPADAWPHHGDSLQAWVAHTARRCAAPVVGVDSVGSIHAGPWQGQVLGGQSPACDARGELLARLADRTAETRVVEVPLPGRAAREQRPHLLLTRDEVPGLTSLAAFRERVLDGPLRAPWQDLLAEVEREATLPPYTPFSQVGTRSEADAARGDRDWIVVHSTGRRILRAALAALVTDERRHAEAALHQIDAVLSRETWHEWQTEAHLQAYDFEADLRTGMFAADLGLAYDWLHPLLTGDERRRIVDGLDARAIQPYLRTVRNQSPWWFDARNNWLTVIVGGLGVCGMALGDDHPDAARLVAMALPRMRDYLSIYGPDGEFNESPPYANSSIKPALFFDALRYHRGDGSPSPEIATLQRHCHWLMYLTTPPGRTAGFGDGHPDYPPVTGPMRAVVAATGDATLAWHLRQYGAEPKFPVLDLLWTTDRVTPQLPATPLARAFPAHSGIVSSRDAWDPTHHTCTVFGIVGNPSINHSHPDPGALIVDGFGQRLVTDLGSVPYPEWSQRPHYYHFNQDGQNIVTFASRPLAWDKRSKARARLLDTEFDDRHGAAWSVETTPLYRDVTSLRRSVVHLLPRIIAVCDEIELPEADSIRLRWHLCDAPVLEDGGSFHIEVDGVRLAGLVSALGDPAASITTGRHRYAPPYDHSRTGVPLPQLREPYLDLTLDAARARLITLFAIQGPDDEPAIWQSGGADSWSIATAQGEVTVTVTSSALHVSGGSRVRSIALGD